MLAFDPKDRASAEDVLANPYFSGLSKPEREPSTQPISKLEFDFERKKLTKDDVRELIYREILEYHPQMLEEYLRGGDQLSFMYPSGVDRFKRKKNCFIYVYDRAQRRILSANANFWTGLKMMKLLLLKDVGSVKNQKRWLMVFCSDQMQLRLLDVGLRLVLCTVELDLCNGIVGLRLCL